MARAFEQKPQRGSRSAKQLEKNYRHSPVATVSESEGPFPDFCVGVANAAALLPKAELLSLSVLPQAESGCAPLVPYAQS